MPVSCIYAKGVYGIGQSCLWVGAGGNQYMLLIAAVCSVPRALRFALAGAGLVTGDDERFWQLVQVGGRHGGGGGPILRKVISVCMDLDGEVHT